MKLLLFSFLMIASLNMTYGQGQLTKVQMYQDFDSLTATIIRVSPHLSFKENITGYHIADSVRKFREEIDTISSYTSFWLLIDKAITICQDGHTGLLSSNETLDSLFSHIRLHLPIRYINSRYIATRGFTFNANEYPAGAELVSINGMNMQQAALNVLPYRQMMKIDADKNCYYYDDIISSWNFIAQRSVELTFRLPDDRLQTDVFYYDSAIGLQPIACTFDDQPRVDYWRDQKTLYLRVPSMDIQYAVFFKLAIQKAGKGVDIKKVIIDMRNNTGGSDLVWIAIYRSLIKNTIRIPNSIYGNDPSYMTKAYQKDYGVIVAGRDTINFLGNKVYYKYSNQDLVYRPLKKSLRLDCKIISVGNDYIYSSCGSAFKVPALDSTDNYISVGRPTGYFLGLGFDPIIFELPNSHIKYRIEPCIDLDRVTNARDAMHDKYDYIIPASLQEFQDKYRYNGNVWANDYLINHDVFIKKALSL